MKFKFSGYGVHPTIYESYTDDLLYGMFRGGIWGTLDEHQRQQLLQETVNREAKAMGQKGACEVRFVDMPANEYGRQYGNVIELNRQNFVEDKRVHQANGYKFVTPFQYSNYQALETVLHENTHAWQNQVIDNTISHSDKQRVAEYRANNFTSSLVADHTADNKTVLRQGSHYLNGVTPNGYYLYYFQATERDAHRYGENRAREIMNQNLTTFGPDQTAEKYKEKIRIAGYQANLKVAQKAFNNENIERDINNTLLNHYYGMSRPVDPETAKIVDHEMSESYKQQHGINQKSNESEKTDTEKTRSAWKDEPPDAGKSQKESGEENSGDVVKEEGPEAASTEKTAEGEDETPAEENAEEKAEVEKEAADESENEERTIEEEQTDNLAEADGENEAPAEETAEDEEQVDDLVETDGEDETPAEETAEEEEQTDDLAETDSEEEAPAEETAEEEEQADDLVETDSEDEAPAEETAEDEEQASDLIGEETADESTTEETAEEEEQTDDLVETDSEGEAPAEETAEDEEQANDLIGEETADESESKETAEDEEQADDLVETDGENEAPAEETAEDEEQASDLIGGGSTDGSADESDSEENVEEEDEEQSYSY